MRNTDIPIHAKLDKLVLIERQINLLKCNIHDYCNSFLTRTQITFLNCDIPDCADVFFNQEHYILTFTN